MNQGSDLSGGTINIGEDMRKKTNMRLKNTPEYETNVRQFDEKIGGDYIFDGKKYPEPSKVSNQLKKR